jgi:predicted DNA-binding transcriptional regulator AlpA
MRQVERMIGNAVDSVHVDMGSSRKGGGNPVQGIDMESSEKFLSVKEVSGMLGWSVDTIRRMIQRGFMVAIVLPCKSNRRRRVYRSMRIAKSEVERCIRAFQA